MMISNSFYMNSIANVSFSVLIERTDEIRYYYFL